MLDQNIYEMKKLLLAGLFLCLIQSVYAQSDTLTTDKVGNYIDKSVIIKAVVAGARRFDSGGERTPMVLINLDENYPNSPLTLVIYKEVLEKMTIDENAITGKKVTATGKISVYRNRNQLVIEKPEDIKFLN